MRPGAELLRESRSHDSLSFFMCSGDSAVEFRVCPFGSARRTNRVRMALVRRPRCADAVGKRGIVLGLIGVKRYYCSYLGLPTDCDLLFEVTLLTTVLPESRNFVLSHSDAVTSRSPRDDIDRFALRSSTE